MTTAGSYYDSPQGKPERAKASDLGLVTKLTSFAMRLFARDAHTVVTDATHTPAGEAARVQCRARLAEIMALPDAPTP